MTVQADNLRECVDRLYDVFATYRMGGNMSHCDHCVTQDEVDRLTGVPLRKLSWDLVGHYSSKAMNTWGDSKDFKHFLPRILEAIAYENYPYDVEVVGNKLCMAEWTNWPPSEQSAVRNYFHALWSCLIRTFPSRSDFPAIGQIDGMICLLGKVYDDVCPFLAEWLEDKSAASLRHIAGFVSANAPRWNQKRKLRNAFWEENQSTMIQTGEWMMSEPVRQRLEDGFFQFSSEEFAIEISESIEILDWARGSGSAKGTVS